MKNKEKKVIKLKIDSNSDRDSMITALANAGYKVWIKSEYEVIYGYIYYVCFTYETN